MNIGIKMCVCSLYLAVPEFVALLAADSSCKCVARHIWGNRILRAKNFVGAGRCIHYYADRMMIALEIVATGQPTWSEAEVHGIV